MQLAEERRLIDQVIDGPARKHPNVATETVAATVRQAHNVFYRLRDFVPLLVERGADQTLSTQIARPAV